VHLKHDSELAWGEEQEEAFNQIKEYLTKPSVLQAPRIGEAFRLYVAAQKGAIGAVLTQESAGWKAAVAYLSWRMLDAEMRYTYVGKLCLALYYACCKFRHYILSSSCTIVCKPDVIKHMMQKPILSGRLGKWAYSLVEYELTYEPLQAMKGKVITDFIADHSTDTGDTSLVEICPWMIFFDGSVCARGCEVGFVIISPGGVMQEMAIQLESKCTNNRAEYEALAAGLEALLGMGVKHDMAYGDSQLVVQQVLGENQRFDGTLNHCLEECRELISRLDMFRIKHIGRKDNMVTNWLAPQASGYEVTRGRFAVMEKPMSQRILPAQVIESKSAEGGAAVVNDWRDVIRSCITDLGGTSDQKV
jgi:ribonuclease HI